jgi:hypothetical protein
MRGPLRCIKHWLTAGASLVAAPRSWLAWTASSSRPEGREMIYNLLRALTKIETGRSCRRCSQPIGIRDHFGMSEAVCPACRR